MRFFAYFFMMVGIVTLVLIVEPVIGQEFRYRFDEIFGRHHNLARNLARVITSEGEGQSASGQQGRGFGDLVFGGADAIVPASTDFGIVIEKINANAKVIPDVDPGNEGEYIQALSQGVAHAKGTAYPGQKGNIYLFSHSTDAPWNVVRYNAVFYLLGKLDPGERIVMFYKGRRYNYIVLDKTIAKPTDTHFLTDTYDQSILTLQTCDPPGTLLNRLIIRAKLAGE